MKIEKVQARIQAAINKFPSTVNVKRSGMNEFDEPAGEEDICTLIGFFHTNSSRQKISLNIQVAGESITKPETKLLVVWNDKAKLVRENDYFQLSGKTYKIVDPNSQQEIYADMVLEEIPWGTDPSSESLTIWKR